MYARPTIREINLESESSSCGQAVPCQQQLVVGVSMGGTMRVGTETVEGLFQNLGSQGLGDQLLSRVPSANITIYTPVESAGATITYCLY